VSSTARRLTATRDTGIRDQEVRLEALGKFMSKWRRFSGLSQDAAAKVVDVSRQTISGWETGKRSPPLDDVRALLDRYGTPNDERRGLLDGSP